MKRALVTGVTGQDGTYLTEFLLGQDYQVHGIKRRSSSFNTNRIDSMYQGPHEEGQRFMLHSYANVTTSRKVLRCTTQFSLADGLAAIISQQLGDPSTVYPESAS